MRYRDSSTITTAPLPACSQPVPLRGGRSCARFAGCAGGIGGTLEPLVAEMLCVVAVAAQAVDGGEADAHVREELHEALTGMDFLASEPSASPAVGKRMSRTPTSRMVSSRVAARAGVVRPG